MPATRRTHACNRSAVQLEASVGDPHLQFGGPPLEPRGAGGSEPAVDVLGDAVVEECACDIEFGGQFGQYELGVLESGHRGAEGLAFPHVGECRLEVPSAAATAPTASDKRS